MPTACPTHLDPYHIAVCLFFSTFLTSACQTSCTSYRTFSSFLTKLSVPPNLVPAVHHHSLHSAPEKARDHRLESASLPWRSSFGLWTKESWLLMPCSYSMEGYCCGSPWSSLGFACCPHLPPTSPSPLTPISLFFPAPLCCRLGAGGYENELHAQETVIIC